MELTLQKYGSYEKFEQATGGSLLSKSRIWSHVRKYMVKEGCLGEVWAVGDLGTWLWCWHLQSVPHTFFFCRFCLISPFNSMNWPLATFLLLLLDSYMCSLWYFVCYSGRIAERICCNVVLLIDQSHSSVSKPWHWQGTGPPHSPPMSWFFLVPVWILGLKLELSSCRASTFVHWAILSLPPRF